MLDFVKRFKTELGIKKTLEGLSKIYKMNHNKKSWRADETFTKKDTVVGIYEPEKRY